MSLSDEGYVKYRCDWRVAPAASWSEVAELAWWRDHLRVLGLVGEYPVSGEGGGVGFGNVSVRSGEREFLITGTQTGGSVELRAEDVTRVVDYDIDANRLACVGPVQASSESLTHAALYECSSSVAAVVHVHSASAWSRLYGTLPTTDAEVPYGTPAMARELIRLYRETVFLVARVAVMGGHRDGLIAFGGTLEEAVAAIVRATLC